MKKFASCCLITCFVTVLVSHFSCSSSPQSFADVESDQETPPRDLSTVKPFGTAICSMGHTGGNSDTEKPCPYVHLGKGVHRLRLHVAQLCDQDDALGLGYICNVTLSPACADICNDSLGVDGYSLQHYIDAILNQNPFRGPTGENLDPWEVPQTDLSLEGSYIFISQRQGLYLYLRTLALKRMFPNSTVVSNETNHNQPGFDGTIINAMEYGLTFGCNWRPEEFSMDPAACSPPRGMWSGVGKAGIQGNVFALLAWARQLAIENGAARLDAMTPCYLKQLVADATSKPSQWCPHDSVIGAVRGGKSGPAARDALDNEAFWGSRLSLHDVGTYPNVCHFEQSEWVWNNSIDRRSDKKSSCRGANDAPGVYGENIRDFMSVDIPGTLAIDIAGAQYGGGRGSASGQTYATQDESTPIFYPETVALGFNSQNRSISTGTSSLIFLGVRRYFSGQSGSHGYDASGLVRPLFNHGNSCGDIKFSKLLLQHLVLNTSVLTVLGDQNSSKTAPTIVQMYKHSLGVITSSCGTCASGNLPTTDMKFRTAGPTCLVQWSNGRSGCGTSPAGGWTYWKDVWIWIGALMPSFYPSSSRRAFGDVVKRIGTGPWGAGVWWGNTLQYFVVTWLAISLLWEQPEKGLQLDYFAYGVPRQSGFPFGGFCEQYQAQGYEDVVRNLPQIKAALEARLAEKPPTLRELYDWLQRCSRCSSNCTFPGVGPQPADVYCTSTCTADFLNCFTKAIVSSAGISV